MSICNNREAYAKYDMLPQLSYNIISYLIEDPTAEIIWKLLSGTDKDDWKSPNLTLTQKRALIYDGSIDATKFRVFMDFGMDDGVHTENAFLRITPATLYPETRTTGIQDITFEILCHYKITHLSNYQTRIDTILQALINCLNGVNIGSLGLLYLNGERSRRAGIQIIGQSPYKGKLLTMSVNLG